MYIWHEQSQYRTLAFALCFGHTGEWPMIKDWDCTGLYSKIGYFTQLSPLKLTSPSNALVITCASFFNNTWVFVSYRTGLMLSQMMAYDNMTGSSLSLSLLLSILMSVSTGCQLKASVTFLVLPNLYWMYRSNRASSRSLQICDTPIYSFVYMAGDYYKFKQ